LKSATFPSPIPSEIIEQEKCNSSYAVEIGLNKIIKTFEDMDDPYMSARSRDIEDMKKRILSKLLKLQEVDLSNLPQNTILVAKELATSDTAKQLKIIIGWLAIHEEEVYKAWNNAVRGEHFDKINPL